MNIFFKLLLVGLVLCQSTLVAEHHKPPIAVGTIDEVVLTIGSNSCGPDELSLSLLPYFESYGEPLTYCLSSFIIDGSTVEHFGIQLNPYTGLLTVPSGWFASPSATIKLRIVAKNPYGSAMQKMNITLGVCGG